MPGHKGNPRFAGAFLTDALSFDLTEVDGLDNLHHPQGLIAESQKKAARLFGAEESFFLVNGATSGIIAALCSVGSADPAGDILAARNSHRSFYSGLVFSGARASYLYPPTTKEGFPGGILPQDVEEALYSNKSISAVYITSPTYEGFASDLKAISAIVHKHDKLLIVDEAHGTHFVFHPDFPDSALESGADIVIQSLHKTLPALTQSAILHVQGNRADRARLKEALSMLQTSSPSYILMASMSRCVDLLSEEADDLFQNYCRQLADFRGDFSGSGKIRLLGGELAGQYGIKAADPGKLIFLTESGFTGKELSDRLRDCRIQVEMHGSSHILAMTSICDTAPGFERLKNGLQEIAAGLRDAVPISRTERRLQFPALPVMPIRQASFSEKKSVPLTESGNCVAGEFIIPYPPGIPLVVPGEMITCETIESVLTCYDDEIPLVGMEKEGCVRIVTPTYEGNFIL